MCHEVNGRDHRILMHRRLAVRLLPIPPFGNNQLQVIGVQEVATGRRNAGDRRFMEHVSTVILQADETRITLGVVVTGVPLQRDLRQLEEVVVSL